MAVMISRFSAAFRSEAAISLMRLMYARRWVCIFPTTLLIFPSDRAQAVCTAKSCITAHATGMTGDRLPVAASTVVTASRPMPKPAMPKESRERANFEMRMSLMVFSAESISAVLMICFCP